MTNDRDCRESRSLPTAFFAGFSRFGLSCGGSSINSAVDIESAILEYFDQSAKGGQLDNHSVGVGDFFVLEFPSMRVRYINGAQSGAHRGIDVRAWTVANHICG